ncbi:MAG: YitT family protein [Desulfopila sp.]
MALSIKIRRKLSINKKEWLVRVGTQQSMIAIGAILSALGFVVFQVPYNLAAGGVSGIAIIVKHYTGFSVGYFILLSNIPLFVLGYFHLGKWRFIWSSTLAMLIFSLGTEYFANTLPAYNSQFPLTDNSLLASIYAGVLYGLGSGLIYRFGGTIGGTSVPARIIHDKTGFPLSQSYLMTDMGIIIIAGLVFSMETAMLALITLVLTGIFSDYVLEGTAQTRTVTIVSKSADRIRDAVVHELRRGVSYWEVTGGYSGERSTMLYFTVLRSRIYDVKFIVSRIDPDAFMVVGVSQQTWGGFNARKL